MDGYTFWLTGVCGPTKAKERDPFWEELYDLSHLCNGHLRNQVVGLKLQAWITSTNLLMIAPSFVLPFQMGNILGLTSECPQ